jgi:NADH-quinone oxidoreductase subunit A
MELLIYAPPITFLIFIVLFFAGSKGVDKLSHRGVKAEQDTGSYACGQRDIENYVNPDYSQFFRYAFFFTIMHVLVLVIATAPYDAMLLPIIFIACGVLSMAILFKR